MPKLSIVIPTLKEETYIAKTVLQFKDLSFSKQIIVSDGGSKDKTVETAKMCADLVCEGRDDRPSPSKQRNDGAQHATGEILAFVDSSVVIPEPQQFFEYIFERFEKEPDLMALTGPQNIFPEIETWADAFFLGCQNQLIRFQNNVLKYGAGTGKFMVMRRSAFESIGGFQEQLIAGEDLDLVRRLSQKGRTEYDPRIGIRYPGRREHGLGWVRLLWVWTVNVWWIWLFGKAYAKEWTPVR